MPGEKKPPQTNFTSDQGLSFMNADLDAGFKYARSRGQVVTSFIWNRHYGDMMLMNAVVHVRAEYKRDNDPPLTIKVTGPQEISTKGTAMLARDLASNMPTVLSSEVPKVVGPPKPPWWTRPVGIVVLAVIGTVVAGLLLSTVGIGV